MSVLKDYSPRVGPAYLGTNFGQLRTARAKYDFAVDGGAIAEITPKTSDTIPDNAIMLACYINSTTAVAATGGAANVSVGIVGIATNTLLAATAKGSFTTDAIVIGIPVPATPVKTSAAGKISISPDTNALTAGVLEIVVVYYQASA